MNIIITPKKLQGSIIIPSDKSFCHRAIISACIANGTSVIKNVNMCDDVKNTINILRQIFKIEVNDKTVYITGGAINKNVKVFSVEESASTLRFLIPLLSNVIKNEITFFVSKTLKKRGINEYYNHTDYNSCEEDESSFIIRDFIDKSEYIINTTESSQYASGILFLCAFLKHDSKIILKGNNESISYIDLTIKILNIFDANIKRINNEIYIKHKELSAKEIECPGDGSVYLIYQVLNKLGSNIEIQNNLLETGHPDYLLAEKIKTSIDSEYDLSDNPDSIYLLPLLKIISDKNITLKNINRLKNKEIDRVQALVDFLNLTKSDYILNDDSIQIIKINFESTTFDSKNDHRYVMFILVLSTISIKPLTINNFECINKSYPDFLNDIQKLGADIKITKKYDDLFYKVNNNKTKIKFDKISNYKTNIYNNKKVCIITEKNIPTEHLLKIEKMLEINKASLVDKYVINKTKENVKTFLNIEKITDFLLDKEYSKDDIIIGFGGGTITDLTGFIGSIYKRGITTVYIPTTLIANVDASIGGKTGINSSNIKNSIGTFYNPKEIFIDTGFLRTLPKKEITSGLMEIIKILSMYNQKTFFDIYDSKNLDNLNDWIYEAIKIKIKIVEQDPFDNNIRKTLNFGHTIGHAIELKEKIPHGIAIGKGMLKESDNIFIKNILKKYNISDCVLDDVDFKNIKNDKKIQNNKIAIVELESIGKCRLIEKDVNDFKRQRD